MSSPADVRGLFLAKLKETPDHGFHPADLDRVKDERYLRRVLKHCESDVKLSCDMLFDIFTWRKTVGANDINENNINTDYVREGIFFPHGRDIDGSLLLIIKSKMHIKGAKDFEELKRIVIYWFDRIEREENGNKVTLFFDLDGCGLANLDMDLTNYLISLFKSYYPYFLNYILIYQMPWVMSAAFKIIKSLLPAKAVEKMKFVNKDTLKEFVDPDQALAAWGGNDNYVFEFISEKNADHTTKKVTFAEQGDNQHSPGEMLRLNPNDTIVFKSDNEEISGQFIITNMDESPISFKIRTTTPEKFRVRPSSGTLTPGASQTIVIVVQPGFQMRTVSKDRFLVMSVQIPRTDLSQKELSELWQTSSGSKVDEYRLKCNFLDKDLPKNGNMLERVDKSDSITNAINNLQINYELLTEQVTRVKIYQMITLILTIVAVVLSYMIYKITEARYCDNI